MANLVPKLINIYRKKFDIQRRLLNVPSRLQFLELDGEDAPFRTIYEVESGWYLDYSTFLQSPILYVATAEDAFNKIIDRSSNLAIGVDVYNISKPSVAVPNGKKPFFRIPVSSTDQTFEP
jgi:hypothetical protein